jgi:hypothetical protein
MRSAGGRAVRIHAPADEADAGFPDGLPHGGEVPAGRAHAAADGGSRCGAYLDLAAWLDREPALARQRAGGSKPGQRGGNPLMIDGSLVVDGRGIVIAVADQPFQLDADRAGTGDDGERPFGKPGLLEEIAEGESGQRGVFGRLVEDGVAGEQRRQEHVRPDKVGIVPGRNVEDRPQGFEADHFFELLGGVPVDDLVAEHLRDVLEKEVDPA